LGWYHARQLRCTIIRLAWPRLTGSGGGAQESEPAFKYLSKSMRWHYHALSLKEEWLHVQVPPPPPPPAPVCV
jgi:hypothetical protein